MRDPLKSVRVQLKNCRDKRKEVAAEQSE